MERSGTLTIRDLDPEDVDALKREAAERSTSLNRLVGELVDRHARTVRNRALLRAVREASHAPVEVDTVGEIRALRDDRDDRTADEWAAR
jgi:hypothetical protein